MKNSPTNAAKMSSSFIKFEDETDFTSRFMGSNTFDHRKNSGERFPDIQIKNKSSNQSLDRYVGFLYKPPPRAVKRHTRLNLQGLSTSMNEIKNLHTTPTKLNSPSIISSQHNLKKDLINQKHNQGILSTSMELKPSKFTTFPTIITNG